MSLNIKNKDVERLIKEVSLLTGESKTEAVRRSLEERRDRLAYQGAANDRGGRLRRFLETEVWPYVPPSELGRKLSRDEEEDILGYGLRRRRMSVPSASSGLPCQWSTRT